MVRYVQKIVKKGNLALRTAASYSHREALIIADRRNAAKFHGKEGEVEAEERLRLEKEKVKLERDLEEERRALRDEEIVRGLATRMLEEERLKSEQIERVLQELQQKFQQKGLRDRQATEDYPEELAISSLEKSMDFEDALEPGDSQYLQHCPGEEDVWQKEDFLIMSTQSI